MIFGKSSIIERVAVSRSLISEAGCCTNRGRQQLRFQENNPGGVIS